MLKSTWLLRWLNYGQQLTAIAAYRHEIYVGTAANTYLAMLIVFPVIGLIMSLVAAAIANPAPGQPGTQPGGGGGGPEPDDRKDDGRRADPDRVPVLVLSDYGE